MTDLGDHGIANSDDNLPFLPFDTYAMRSLFPHARGDHPVLLSLERRLKVILSFSLLLVSTVAVYNSMSVKCFEHLLVHLCKGNCTLSAQEVLLT